MTDNAKKLKEFIIKMLDEKKVEQINVMELPPEVALAKYMIFATGRSIKNISAIANAISLELKHQLHHSSYLEGLKSSGWVVMDAGDVILHLFDAETRETIKLEDLWNKKQNKIEDN